MPVDMMKAVLGLSLVVLTSASLFGQASTTASRRFDVQAGGQFVIAKSDYSPQKFKGAGVYATVDFTYHLGAEIDFRQLNSPADSSYERTYEAGVRYHRTYGRFAPYIKGMYGRGVFNFVQGSTVLANLAYNEFVGGVGTDIRILPYLNARADYEYQSWRNFPDHGLTPQLLSIGVAYHFPGALKRGRHF